MKIYGCYDGSARGVYRVQLPLTAMRIMAGHEVQLRDKILPSPGDGFDVIVMNMQRIEASDGVSNWFARHQANGTIIVVDLDDDVWELVIENPIHTSAEHLAAAEQTLRLADMVTTTNERLAEKILEFNENVVVIPNHVPATNVLSL